MIKHLSGVYRVLVYTRPSHVQGPGVYKVPTCTRSWHVQGPGVCKVLACAGPGMCKALVCVSKVLGSILGIRKKKDLSNS